MTFTYIIQKNAMEACNTILPLPENIKIDKKYLQNINENEFRSALREIHGIFQRFYNNMAVSPEDFGMIKCSFDEDFDKGMTKTISCFNKLKRALDLIFTSVNNIQDAIEPVSYTHLQNAVIL